MSDLLIAQTVEREFVADGHVASVTLDYEARFLRRKRLVTDQGWAFLVDLEKTTSLNDGDAFRLADGSHVKVIAADEPLMSIMGDNLMRLAWHIGNRHTPCQIERDRLVIQCDPVIRHMLEHLGAEIREVFEPFSPEGGAYGEGRTHSHEHGRTAHAH